MNYPSLKDELQLLQKYRDQKGWNNATLALSMTSMGWSWTSTFIRDLFIGTAVATTEQRKYIQIYLLNSYYEEVLV